MFEYVMLHEPSGGYDVKYNKINQRYYKISSE